MINAQYFLLTITSTCDNVFFDRCHHHRRRHHHDYRHCGCYYAHFSAVFFFTLLKCTCYHLFPKITHTTPPPPLPLPFSVPFQSFLPLLFSTPNLISTKKKKKEKKKTETKERGRNDETQTTQTTPKQTCKNGSCITVLTGEARVRRVGPIPAGRAVPARRVIARQVRPVAAVLGGAGEAGGVVGQLRDVVVGGDGHGHAAHGGGHGRGHDVVVLASAAVRGEGWDGRFDALLVLLLQRGQDVSHGERGAVRVLGAQGHVVVFAPFCGVLLRGHRGRQPLTHSSVWRWR